MWGKLTCGVSIEIHAWKKKYWLSFLPPNITDSTDNLLLRQIDEVANYNDVAIMGASTTYLMKPVDLIKEIGFC